MTIRVTMKQPAFTTGGVLCAVGSTYTVPKDVGYAWIQQGQASDIDGVLTLPRTEVPGPLVPAIQALVSGVGFPLADAVAAGASASYVELLGSYITMQNNVPTSISGISDAAYAVSTNNSHVYIDPVLGNDANSGYAPDTAKRTMTASNWTAGYLSYNPNMTILVKRGSTHSITYPLGQGAGGMSGSMSLGSYGDPALPRPTLNIQPSAVVLNSGLLWTNPDAAVLMDVILDCSALDSASAARNGVRMFSNLNTDPLQNVLVSNVQIRAPRTAPGTWPGGLVIHKATTANSSSAITRSGNIRVEGCEVYGGGAHGMSLLGALGYQRADGTWGGVEVIDNVVRDCGKDYDSHAITFFGDSAAYLSSTTWVLVSGTTYYNAYGTAIGRSVGDVDMVSLLYSSRDSCIHYFTKNTSAPTAPAVGEFGFDNATQRIYLNTGVALVSGTDILMTSGQPPRGMIVARNQASGMLLQGNNIYREGAGLQFDDWVSDSIMFCNRSFNNGGAGLAINKGLRNRLIRNLVQDNLLVGIINSGGGTLIEANVVRGSSNRSVSEKKGLIAQDMINGPSGSLVTQMRRNLLIATSQLDAYIVQTDASGYRGNYTRAQGNQGIGPTTQQSIGKVIGF